MLNWWLWLAAASPLADVSLFLKQEFEITCLRFHTLPHITMKVTVCHSTLAKKKLGLVSFQSIVVI